MNIVLSNISKSYNGTRALRECSVAIEKGISTAVIGPNGSGKSTLLRIAALIEGPGSGKVSYGEFRSADDVKKLRQLIGVVLSGDTLFNDSVYDNVAYGLKIRKMNKNELRGKVSDMLASLSLSDKAGKHAMELSSGEAQRVAVARALVTEPEYLFLDEPTASLDPLNTEIIENALQEIRALRRMTIVTVTHNMFQTKRIADRVMMMYEGKVIEENITGAIFDSPENEITRRFINGIMVY
ncbi:MAG: ATP-binding cassette domain-containing protein [Nitrospirota bacterium]|nr:MAG: ATP-binding cassette domain-containing protein [Nitrospirota bacterium]